MPVFSFSTGFVQSRSTAVGILASLAIAGMWHDWQATFAKWRPRTSAFSPACGFSWQFSQTTLTSRSSCALMSAPPGILWFFATWHSTHSIPLAMWTSLSLVGTTPCLWFGPPPVPAWHLRHISPVGLPTARARRLGGITGFEDPDPVVPRHRIGRRSIAQQHPRRLAGFPPLEELRNSHLLVVEALRHPLCRFPVAPHGDTR